MKSSVINLLVLIKFQKNQKKQSLLFETVLCKINLPAIFKIILDFLSIVFRSALDRFSLVDDLETSQMLTLYEAI